MSHQPIASVVSEQLGRERTLQDESAAAQVVVKGADVLVKTKATLDTVTAKVEQLTKLAKTVAGDNPVLSGAIDACKSVFAVGQSLPFVAPIFSVLQVIVDIELRAREADAKCQDLLERITFMVEHLSVLETVTVHQSTEKVIARMEQVLKSAAALIGAYRKLGAIARRLNTGNKERFASCAKDIASCTNDLMFSLQIQQTSQLNVLTRAVQVDEADEAADAFLKEHGGLEAVKSNPELVKLFASEIKVQVDDASLKELNSNIGDLIAQNRIEMESKFKENMSEAVADGIKGLAETMRELERERVYGCVQCGQSFRESTNAEGSCTFHESQYNDFNGGRMCCGKQDPCKRTKHRAKHHCEYKYEAFFEMAGAITRYTDTTDVWVEETVPDFDNEDMDQSFFVGKLRRMTTGASLLTVPTIVVSLGAVFSSSMGYHFALYTREDLAAIEATAAAAAAAESPDGTVAPGTIPMANVRVAPGVFLSADWLLDANGAISGVHIACKTSTLDLPVEKAVRFDPETLTMVGEVEHIRGGFAPFKPASPYVLPEPVTLGRVIPDRPVRAVRTDFKTQTTPEFPVVVITSLKPPLQANTDRVHPSYDLLESVVSVFNKHTEPVAITSVEAVYRLVGDSEYHDLEDFKVSDVKFPATIDPRKALEIKFTAYIKRSDAEIKLRETWRMRALVARFRPLRLRLTLTDIEGNTATHVLEHVFQPHKRKEREDTDIGFVTFHDWETQTVYAARVTVKTGRGDDYVVTVRDNDYTVDKLNRIVHKAMKTGETEVEIGSPYEFGYRAVLRVFALVDVSCRRVYAFKLLIVPAPSVAPKTAASLAYVACPVYPGSDQVMPTRYATEKVGLPDLDPMPETDAYNDDTYDDAGPPSMRRAARWPDLSRPARWLLPAIQSVDAKLASIDSNLSRTATALEGLIALLKTMALHNNGQH
ncbi:hypothetical protein HK105_203733 [Polyrhizophydium stewartii]|uniref:Mixed lineage kinase domain-containing protein n=1 Tax=Polyrhizophydium stewartii TaxID=2732419 RepID=A0ABR4NAZ1_9FUNG